MSSCRICLSPIKKNQLKLACADCKSDFHAKCVKMSQSDVDFLEEQGTVWRCDPCSTERRKSMRLESSVQGGSLTLDDIMKVLNDIREDQRRTVQDFNKSYDTLNERLEENTRTLQTGLGRIEEFVQKMDELKSENATLRKKVSELESRVEEMEQYSRRNCVEVQGIPEEQGENVIEVVKKVGKALDMSITDDMIDACHRVGRKDDPRGPRGIIVKFLRRIDRDTLVQKRRAKKRDFSTRHFGLSMDRPVFINESLSPSRRKLLGSARQVRKERGYKYLWLRGGNILLRKEEGSPVIEVKCQADIDNL